MKRSGADLVESVGQALQSLGMATEQACGACAEFAYLIASESCDDPLTCSPIELTAGVIEEVDSPHWKRTGEGIEWKDDAGFVWTLSGWSIGIESRDDGTIAIEQLRFNGATSERHEDANRMAAVDSRTDGWLFTTMAKMSPSSASRNMKLAGLPMPKGWPGGVESWE